MDDDERKKLAREIIKQFFDYIDINLGKSVRKKLFVLAVVALFCSAVFFGLLDLSKVL
jgi:hypothetical protein